MSALILPPYSHDLHAGLCRLAAQACVVFVQYVQARSRGAVYCCVVYRPAFSPDGVPLWVLLLLDRASSRLVVPVRNVRQCSGVDGRCTCAGDGAGHGDEAALCAGTVPGAVASAPRW